MPSRSRSSPANQLRIIGGQWRSRVIHFPVAAQVRPTPDRVRETLFNWLGQELPGMSVLDLFAGSGALAFESLSRGAGLAVVVDSNADAVASLRDNAAKLGAVNLEIHRSDAMAFLAGETRRFDIVFADPPFGGEWFPKLWPLIDRRVADGGWLYAEHGGALAAPDGWEVFRRQKAGIVHYHLLRRLADFAGDGTNEQD